jgi:hypothetical protein
VPSRSEYDRLSALPGANAVHQCSLRPPHSSLTKHKEVAVVVAVVVVVASLSHPLKLKMTTENRGNVLAAGPTS